jgi:hypothetical protein
MGRKFWVSSKKIGVNLGSGVLSGKFGVVLMGGPGWGGTIAEQADKKTSTKLNDLFIYLKTMPYLQLLKQ